MMQIVSKRIWKKHARATTAQKHNSWYFSNNNNNKTGLQKIFFKMPYSGINLFFYMLSLCVCLTTSRFPMRIIWFILWVQQQQQNCTTGSIVCLFLFFGVLGRGLSSSEWTNTIHISFDSIWNLNVGINDITMIIAETRNNDIRNSYCILLFVYFGYFRLSARYYLIGTP